MSNKYEFPVRKWGDSDRNQTRLSISIDGEGTIIYDGYDSGPDVHAAPGADSDYEYRITVSKNYAGDILLKLLKRFEDEVQFKEWLEANDIPFDFWTY